MSTWRGYFPAINNNNLNVNQMTMEIMTFATEAEMWRKVRELLSKEGSKIQIIGRRKIIIFK